MTLSAKLNDAHGRFARAGTPLSTKLEVLNGLGSVSEISQSIYGSNVTIAQNFLFFVEHSSFEENRFESLDFKYP